MYVQISTYHFKNKAAEEEGIEYLKSTLIPHEAAKFGFIDHILTDAQEEGIVLMCRYRVRENTYGKGVEREGFRHFLSLLERTPSYFAGPNRALGEYERASK